VCPLHGGSFPSVRAKANERLADLIDPDRVLRQAAALAYSDVSDLYTEDFKLKPMRDWPPALRQAIKRIEPRLANVDPGDGASDQVLRLEMHDKIKPLEMLFKHLGLLTEKLEHSGAIEIKWQG
jgi:phage terminase small subunit